MLKFRSTSIFFPKILNYYLSDVNFDISISLRFLLIGSKSWKNLLSSNSVSLFWNIFLNSLLTDYKYPFGKNIITLSSFWFYASISVTVFCMSTWDILFRHSNCYIYMLYHKFGNSLTSDSNSANDIAKNIVLFCSHTAFYSCLKWSFFNFSILMSLLNSLSGLPIVFTNCWWVFWTFLRIKLNASFYPTISFS